MKRLFLVCAAALALVVGVSSKADAAISTQLQICQGATCVDFFGGAGVTSGVNQIVGDYQIFFSGGATVEEADFAQSQTISLQVRRIDDTSADPLDIWLQATGYTLPTGPVTLDTTLGATSAPGNPGALIEFQAWLSTTNAAGFPPAGSIPTAVIGCNPVGAGPGACGVQGDAVVIDPTGTPYSLVTLTRLNIGIGDALIYGSTGQASVTPIPEPMSLMLLGSGLLGIGATARRRRNQK